MMTHTHTPRTASTEEDCTHPQLCSPLS